MRYTENVESGNNDSCCEACGRMFGNPIQLTNLSAIPMQTYNACPFCFSKLKLDNFEVLASGDAGNTHEETQKNTESPAQSECPHYLGYLKKRPKNTPIPDSCLVCQKMIQCILH